MFFCRFLDVKCRSYFTVVRNLTKMLFIFFFLCSDGDEGIGPLFRVQDANLRARVALQALERWPLSACLELLEFCLNDPSTETSLRTDLELKNKELDLYRWVIYRADFRLSYLFLISREIDICYYSKVVMQAFKPSRYMYIELL